jgi:hypothetical protein
MSQDFDSTASILKWLLEKPEVNLAVHIDTGLVFFLCVDGSLMQGKGGNWYVSGEGFSKPNAFKKHVELPKVTIDREILSSAWDKALVPLAWKGSTNSPAFKRLCEELGLL